MKNFKKIIIHFLLVKSIMPIAALHVNLFIECVLSIPSVLIVIEIPKEKYVKLVYFSIKIAKLILTMLDFLPKRLHKK